ncbi:MAG: hypothetical protein ACHQ49_07560 [Elusimicrobiota bacterium]
MKIRTAGILAAALACALAEVGCLSRAGSAKQDDPAAAASRGERASAVVARWSDLPAAAARALLQEYGVPDVVRDRLLVWENDGPWRRIVVRDARANRGEGGENGCLEQSIDYALTPAQAAAVAFAFGGTVMFNPRNQELTARSDAEGLNYLRLNLAHDVARGALPEDRARDEYARIISLAESGKTSPYLLGLSFGPEQ